MVHERCVLYILSWHYIFVGLLSLMSHNFFPEYPDACSTEGTGKQLSYFQLLDSKYHGRGQTHSFIKVVLKLGSVAGPVIQANGRLTFEVDLRSGGPLCFTTE